MTTPVTNLSATSPVGATLVPTQHADTLPNPSAVSSVEPAPAHLYINPEYRFDPTVGLVVMEFHDGSGNLTNTIPTQRQLDAYRLHQQTPPGQGPPEANNAKAPAR